MRVWYEATEEFVLNPDVNPLAKLGFRFYRFEVHVGSEMHEYGSIWLPKYIDISEFEDGLNCFVDEAIYER